MKNLSNLFVKTETLQILVDTLKKKGDKGIELTISTDDKNNAYSQNVVAWVSQSKEDRDAKKSRFFVGNGRVIWGDGLIPKEDTSEQASSSTLIVGDDDDLPF